MPFSSIENLLVNPVSGALRAGTFGRGVMEVHTTPPANSLIGADGVLTLLRVNNVGGGYGPPGDWLDAEVIVRLDGAPRLTFGVPLRDDVNAEVHKRMFEQLKDAYTAGTSIHIDYIRKTLHTGEILRVTEN